MRLTPHLSGRLPVEIGVFLISVCCQPAICRAADPPPQIVTAGGETFAATLESIDSNGQLRFQFNDKTESLAANEFLRWSHPRRIGPQPVVLLRDGSQLVTAADWSRGTAVRIENDREAVVRTELWGDVTLPRPTVHGIVFAQRNHPQERQQLQDQAAADTGDSDQVLLSNGDRLTGSIIKLAGGTITLTTPAGDAELPLSRVLAVILGSSAQAKTEKVAKLVVGLYDGSLLNAIAVTTDKSHLDLQLAGGTKLSGGTRDDVAFLQSLGGNFDYLSDLEPADYRHIPYLTLAWPYERDRNVLGEPLTVGGQRYLKGIGMHSAARLTYRLDGKYRRFDASIALDDSAGATGSVVFTVYVIRNGKPLAAFTSDIVRGGSPPQNVSVDVAGAQGLMLTVDFADRGDELDHADWLDARLVR